MDNGTTTAHAGRDWWRPIESKVAVADSSAGVGGRDGATPFWAVVAFTFVLILAPQAHMPALKPLHLAFMTAALAGLTLLINRVIQGRRLMEQNRAFVFAACLAVWSIAMVPLSYWPGGSFAMLFSVYFKALVVFWLIGTIVDTAPRLRLLVWCLSLIAVPLSMSAVETFFTGGFHSEAASHGLHRISGYKAALTANPNDLALMINLLLPLTVSLMFCVRRLTVRLLLMAIITLDAIAVVATYSRGGFLTLAVVVFLYTVAMLRRGRRALAVVAVLVAMMGLPFLPSSYVNRMDTITQIQADQTGSSQARWRDIVAATKYVMGHPLIGTGAGMNYLALNEIRGKMWVKVHDVYLEYAMDLGLPGLLLFVLLFREALSSTRTAHVAAARGQAEPELFYLAEGVRISLLGFAAAALFYPDAYQFYFYYIAGMAVATKTIAAKSSGADTRGQAGGGRSVSDGDRPTPPLRKGMEH